MDALAALAAAGFDIAHTFDAVAVARELGLAPLGAARLGILIGNTRALWPPFTAALRDPALAAERDPLDRYTERAIDAAFAPARIYYGHRRYDGAFLPLQHIAIATGLGAMAPSRLVIHPIYGPWFALRAVVVTGFAVVTSQPLGGTTRSNSTEMGGRASRVTSSMPCKNEDPARSELANRVMVSGSCVANAARRWRWRCCRSRRRCCRRRPTARRSRPSGPAGPRSRSCPSRR